MVKPTDEITGTPAKKSLTQPVWHYGLMRFSQAMARKRSLTVTHICAVESSSASEEVEIVFDATGLNLDTDNENMVARSAGGWTFKVTGSKGTAERVISSDPEGTPLPAVGILEEIRVKGNGANWMYLKAVGQFLVDGGESNVLTFASNKDLEVFQPFDDVQQDSGYTPETSAITVANTVNVDGDWKYPTNANAGFKGAYYDNKYWVVSGDGSTNGTWKFQYSDDGIDWTEKSASGTNGRARDIAYGTNRIVIVASSSSSGTTIHCSTNPDPTDGFFSPSNPQRHLGKVLSYWTRL